LCQAKSYRHILYEEKVVNRGCWSIVFEEAAFEWNPEKMGLCLTIEELWVVKFTKTVNSKLDRSFKNHAQF